MGIDWIDWIYFADNDIDSAKIQMEGNGSTGHVAVCCQQAIEKYFKGHLIKSGWELSRTHNLLQLHREIENIQSWNLDKNLLKDLNGVYIDDRYPGSFGTMPDGLMPSEEEIQSYFELAQEVETIFKKLNITSIGDIKEIIAHNYSIELDSEKIASINDAINSGKIEPYQAYNAVIEEIRETRRRSRRDKNGNNTQRNDGTG